LLPSFSKDQKIHHEDTKDTKNSKYSKTECETKLEAPLRRMLHSAPQAFAEKPKQLCHMSFVFALLRVLRVFVVNLLTGFFDCETTCNTFS